MLEAFSNPTGWLARYHQLLAGYDSVCPLTPEERAAVPWVMLAVELACAGYFSSLDRHRSLSENTVRLLRWLCAHERQLTL